MRIKYADIISYLKKLSDTDLKSLRDEIDKELDLREVQRKSDEKRDRAMELLNLKVSARLYNILKSAQIDHLKQLEQLTKKDFLELKNAGPTTLKELTAIMNKFDVSFKDL